MKTTRSQVSLILLAILPLAGAVRLVAWLVGLEEAKYFQLAAAVVTGTATLYGILLGVLVLRFNYISQSNPLKLELYKKQCEALCAVYEKMSYMMGLPSLRFQVIEGKGKYDQNLRNELLRERKKLESISRRYSLYLPDDVHKQMGLVLLILMDYASVATHPDHPDYEKDLRSIPRHLFDAWSSFILKCRKHIGSETLSGGILELVGGKEYKSVFDKDEDHYMTNCKVTPRG